MIYALNTLDVSDHERRQIARALRDNTLFPTELTPKITRVCDAKIEDRRYRCIYCLKVVHRSYNGKKFSFHHQTHEGKGCIGGEKEIPGVMNPPGKADDCEETP